MVLSVVGNKTDLESQRKVTREEALQYAASIGGNYFESSALHDEGDVFFTILQHICNMTIQYQVLLVAVLFDSKIQGA
jgi:Ras-related protein Rab-21